MVSSSNRQSLGACSSPVLHGHAAGNADGKPEGDLSLWASFPEGTEVSELFIARFPAPSPIFT